MRKSESVQDRFAAGQHAGAGMSIQLTLKALRAYKASGHLPRVGADQGLRQTLNDLLAECLETAERRGAARARRKALRAESLI